MHKYFDGKKSQVVSFLGSKSKRILDAGCGSGGSALALFGSLLKDHKYFGLDISKAVTICQQRFTERGIPGKFFRCSLEKIPISMGDFDIIFSEGVLHHTDSVKKAIASLAKRLRKGGQFLFYVYAKKAPIREFTDDLIRNAIAKMSHQEAWDALLPLTELGRLLGESKIKVKINKGIPFLGISKGNINLQRLFYYKICKAYYHPDFTINEMNHVNFDWFRPKNCFRHTPEEIRIFCNKAGLKITRLHIEDSGITVIAKK